MEISTGYIILEDELRLHYHSIGTGVEAVIIASAASLAADLGELARNRRLIFYDQRGRGQSDFDPDGSHVWYDYEVDDMEAVRQHFDLEQISLIGWSYNGGMSALYAAKYPEHVKRLIMMCPIPPRSQAPYHDQKATAEIAEKRLNPEGLEWLEAMRKAGLDTSDPASYCREYQKVHLPRQMGKPEALSRMRSDPFNYPNEWIHNKDEHTRLHVPKGSREWDWRNRIKAIESPVLIIHGELDLIPIEASREWASVISDARLLVIPECGHFAHLEAPEIYFPAVERFLNDEWPDGAMEVS